jgi:enamine deaminase RidA (YjgF/YER057c/UK114 family)
MNLDKVLTKHGLEFPNPPAKGGVYTPAQEFGNGFYYLSGCTPVFNGEKMFTGKLGQNISIEEGQQAARYCALNLLANLKEAIGDLSKVKKIVKTLVFVACADDFFEQPAVANGGTQLFEDIFGVEIGRSARSAVGVNALPGNVPVEIEILVEVEI